MPTLTDDQALARYRAIVAREGVEPNHILEKSSLYQRLKAGKQALAYPPPLAYSYPWYEVVESSTPLPIDEPAAWAFPEPHPDLQDPSEKVVIFQTLWSVVSRENGRLQLTYPGWRERGMRWEAWADWCTADQAGATLLCHHDPQKGILRTEEELDRECEMHVARWVDALRVAATLDKESAISHLTRSDADETPRASRFQRGVAEQRLDYALKELTERQQLGKPDLPTHEEVMAKQQHQKQSLLGEHWKVEGGLLYRHSWWIQRVAPTTLPESAYLDIN